MKTANDAIISLTHLFRHLDFFRSSIRCLDAMLAKSICHYVIAVAGRVLRLGPRSFEKRF